MRVWITDRSTEQLQVLSFTDQECPESGNHAQKVIESYHGLINGQFNWSSDSKVFLCTEKTYRSWEIKFNKLETLHKRILNLMNENPNKADFIEFFVLHLDNQNLEKYVNQVNHFLDDFE